MSVVVHRSIRKPICKVVEPIGEAHYALTIAALGVSAKLDAVAKDEEGGAAPKEVFTAEVR